MKSPYKTPYAITQGFAKNFNPYYVKNGLKGHNAIDMAGQHLAPIYAVTDSYCYSHTNRENGDLSKYRAVYTLVELQGAWYEISYGHLWDILAFPKTYLTQGAQIGTQGNTGNVFVGGKAPTYAEKKKGAGSHLHLQFRAVKPVDKRDITKHYLSDMNGSLKYMDKFWEVLDYNNGYHGCVDPQPFLDNKVKEVLTETLKFGSRGEQVKVLQRKLGVYDDGIFGQQTSDAVRNFQIKNGLAADSIVGARTREKLNQS